jgi:hypothetical protein
LDTGDLTGSRAAGHAGDEKKKKGATAAAAVQTIDDIVKKGTIVVGVSTTTPIFGLIGQNGEPGNFFRFYLYLIRAAPSVSCRCSRITHTAIQQGRLP